MSSIGWLPLWKWPHPEHPDAEIFPIYASEEIQQALPDIKIDLTKIHLLDEDLSDHHKFTGVVYFLRNIEKPGIVKIGSTNNFKARTSSIQRRQAFDYMRPESAQSELIFACLEVPDKAVEKQAHLQFGPPEAMESRAREWFRATPKEVANFMGQRILRIDGRVMDYRMTRGPRDNLFKACIDQSSGPRLLSDLGDVLRVYKRGNVFTVVSSLWLPVRPLSSRPHYDIPASIKVKGNEEVFEKIRRLEIYPCDLCIDIDILRGIPSAIVGNLRIDRWDHCFFDQFGHDGLERMEDYDEIYKHVDYSANLMLTEIINVGGGGKIMSYNYDFQEA